MSRRPTKQERQIAALLKRYEAQTQAAFLEAMRAAAATVDFAALIAALEANDIARALDLLRINQQTLFPVGEAVRTAYLQGGASVAAGLPIRLRGTFGFGGNPRAVAQVQRIVGQMIEGVQAETLAAVRGYITTAVAEGVPPRRMALEITGRMDGGRSTGGIFGLNSNQTDAVIRARRELADLDPNYFTRKRRDRRLDARVEAAIRSGTPLTQAEIDAIAGRYKDRLLNLRGKTIARTETLNALRAGQHDGFATLIDAGAVEPGRMTVTWLATTDARTRDAHAALGGTTVLFGELFVSPAGGVMAHPGDTSHGAGPADIVSCRCAAVYRIAPRNG
jgi:hypothetical protein